MFDYFDLNMGIMLAKRELNITNILKCTFISLSLQFCAAHIMKEIRKSQDVCRIEASLMLGGLVLPP